MKTSKKMSIVSKNKLPVQLFIFVALACEAKPLVHFFKLKKDSDVHPFPIYKTNEMVLTVAGVGKVSMAGAVAYSLAVFKHASIPVLLNVGVAGHKIEPVGGLFKVMKIIDGDSDKAHYPPIIAKNTLSTAVLTTVSKPVTQYKADMLYDMEGAAFYEMAIRFTSSEWVQCIKIVSDNEQSPIENINAKQVQQWIVKHVSTIDIVIKDLLLLSRTLMSIESYNYQYILEEWHFTVSGKIKLRSLLARWRVLTDNNEFIFNKKDIKNAKEMLEKLEAELDRLAFFL